MLPRHFLEKWRDLSTIIPIQQDPATLTSRLDYDRPLEGAAVVVVRTIAL